MPVESMPHVVQNCSLAQFKKVSPCDGETVFVYPDDNDIMLTLYDGYLQSILTLILAKQLLHLYLALPLIQLCSIKYLILHY